MQIKKRLHVNSIKVAGADTLYITKVKFGIARTSTAPAVTVNMYYSTTTSDVNTNFFAVPPVFIGTVSLPASKAKSTTYVTIGDSSTTLFKIPVSSPDLFTGYHSFFLGLSLSSSSTANGWALVNPNFNTEEFWLLDQDTTSLLYFGGPPQPSGSFCVQVYGTTVPNALPVSFTSFNGILQNNTAFLNWSTANEQNNKGFDVEKSLDDQTFNSIGFVASHGNSVATNNYSFNDAKLVSGNNYYRLKQIDLNGNFKYSSTIKLAFNKFDWAILGNGSSNTWMQLQLDKQSNVAIQIVSLNGNVIQTINKGSIGQGTYSLPIDLSHAASGIYVVKLMVNGETFSKNIMK